MTIGQKLFNKIARLELFVKKHAKDYDKVNMTEEVLADSPGAYELARKIQRKFDETFGYDSIAKEPYISFEVSVNTLERYDFDLGAGTDYGMRITLSAGLVEAIGVRAKDKIEIREGTLKGKTLTVISVVDSTHLRLEDVATFGLAESNIVVNMMLSSEEKGKK